jgi:glycosyltransferase involved in cell wall biosynthesis
VLPVSHVLADMVKQAGVPSERIVVIPNGIDEEFFSPPDSTEAKRLLRLDGKTVLGFVGFVREWHGLEGAIDLLADPRCPSDLHLLVVGDGPALPQLKERAERFRSLEKVTFAGLVDRAALARHLAAIDIALQPSAVDYASPLKLFEYMGFGTAIVAPDQPNIREILVDGESARLFDPANRAAFGEAVLEVARETGLRERLGAAARRTIVQRGYTWANNAQRITALYRDQRRNRHKEARLGSRGSSSAM